MLHPGYGADLCEAQRLAERLLSNRVFGDDAGRLNRSVVDVDGELLLVPQFTLAADIRKGTRPSLGRAALVPGTLPRYHPSAGVSVMHGLGFT